jgi:hypothetical protein
MIGKERQVSRLISEGRFPNVKKRAIGGKGEYFLSHGYAGWRSPLLKWLLFAFILFLISGMASAKSFEARTKAGEYVATVMMDKNPPVIGDNSIEIEIRDAGGKRITDAKVLVNYYMPPMPRMAPMNYKTDARLKGERYKATMNFIMSGPWVIAIKINRDGKTSTAKFNVNAQ